MIEFGTPQLNPAMGDFTQLPELMKIASASIGFSISLGARFLKEGIKDIDENIFPKLKAILPKGVWPRIVPGYATLLWFTEQVC